MRATKQRPHASALLLAAAVLAVHGHGTGPDVPAVGGPCRAFAHLLLHVYEMEAGYRQYGSPASPPWVAPPVLPVLREDASTLSLQLCGYTSAWEGRNVTEYSPILWLDGVEVDSYELGQGSRCGEVPGWFFEGASDVVATAESDIVPPCLQPITSALRIAVTDRKCSFGHTLMLTSYSRMACEAHGTPTFQFRVYFKDYELNETHTLRLKAFKAGDANRTALPGVRVTAPRGGRVLNGTLPGGAFHPSLVGVWEYTVPAGSRGAWLGDRDVNLTLQLPRAAGLYGVEAQVLDNGNDCGPATARLAFAVDPEPEAPDRLLKVLRADQCYDKFYARGPAYWAKGGRGWRMWDGVAGNAGYDPFPTEPAEDVMLCQPGCCAGRPACYNRGAPPLVFLIGDFSADGEFHAAGEHHEADCPYSGQHRDLCHVSMSLAAARGMINGEDWAFIAHLVEDYEDSETGARYGFLGSRYSPRKAMYRHLIANWLNYLASYRSAPRSRPHEKLLRFAIWWLRWGEGNFPNDLFAIERSEQYWSRAWNSCSWPQLCGSRAAAEAFLATQDPYRLPSWELPQDLANLTFAPGTVSPQECGRCIAKQLNYYPLP